ncbi:MAG: TatD family hydrolase [Chlorobiota bacterium]|nr:TatD family hydrolase [Chlorobiota bacterium]QQS66513.1 MAG: TatD family hydrolase [Chlorobiota bacterium]
MIPFIDFHTHNYSNKIDVIEILNLSFDNLELLSKYCSIGIHPWFIDDDKILYRLNQLSEFAIIKNIISIGEVGLDKFIDKNIDIQIKVFINQVQISEKLSKPLTIHCVKAFNEIIALKKSLKPKMPWIIHGFNKSLQTALSLTSSGFYISFGESIFKDKIRTKKILDELPFDKLFFETDNSSKFSIEEIYIFVATLTGVSLSNLKEQIYHNFLTVFGNEFRLA